MQRLGRFALRGRERVSGIVWLSEKVEPGVCKVLLNLAPQNVPVMPGLDSGIHHLRHTLFRRWITGSSPAMTISIGVTVSKRLVGWLFDN
jgi:hypothetical protein